MNRKTLSELQDVHLDMMLHLAFLQESEEEIEAHLSEPVSELTDAQKALADRAFRKAMARWEKERKAAAHKRRLAIARAVTRRGIEIAACVIVIAGVALPVAFAASPAFRSRVMQLLISYDQRSQEAHVRFVESPALSFDVPEAWQGNYYPSYIPEGFSMASCSSLLPKVSYESGDGGQMDFYELDEAAEGTLGTGGGSVSSVMVGAQEGQMIESTADGLHIVDLVWAADDRWFHLSALNIERDEVLRIAESVRRVLRE